jgi:hypothetical protein
MSARAKTTKPSDSTAVDKYVEALQHPLADLAATVRKTTSSARTASAWSSGTAIERTTGLASSRASILTEDDSPYS